MEAACVSRNGHQGDSSFSTDLGRRLMDSWLRLQGGAGGGGGGGSPEYVRPPNPQGFQDRGLLLVSTGGSQGYCQIIL